jgi:hypothetical protein
MDRGVTHAALDGWDHSSVARYLTARCCFRAQEATWAPLPDCIGPGGSVEAKRLAAQLLAPLAVGLEPQNTVDEPRPDACVAEPPDAILSGGAP